MRSTRSFAGRTGSSIRTEADAIAPAPTFGGTCSPVPELARQSDSNSRIFRFSRSVASRLFTALDALMTADGQGLLTVLMEGELSEDRKGNVTRA